MIWIQPQAVFDGGELRNDLALVLEKGIIIALCSVEQIPLNATLHKTQHILAPGVLDLQVNGGGGVMLNSTPTPAGVRAIAAAHNSVGTANIFPTVITDRHEIIEKAAFAVLEEYGKEGIAGLHIEGPHINPAHKGTHDPDLIREIDGRTFRLLETLRTHNLPVLLTLAPETVPAGTIARLSRMGVTVSAGHSAASAKETETALAEGLRGFTHLFNGMPQMRAREPGIVGAAINSTVWCGIIADGHHVDNRMIQMTFRARPRKGRMILVSDAMATIAGPESFQLYGQSIHVENGRLINKRVNSLAGAHIDMAGSIRRLVHEVGIGLEEALMAAVSAPRAFMKLPQADLTGARIDEILVLDNTLSNSVLPV